MASNRPPPPDLLARYKLKSKYADLQRAYARALETRKDLKLEAAEKDAKVQRLQDEVDLVIDQVFDSDYRHLKPAKEELFSDSEEAGNARQEEEDDDGSDSSSEDDEEEGDEEDDSPWGRGQGDNGNERVRKAHDEDAGEARNAKRVKMEDGVPTNGDTHSALLLGK